MSTLTAPLCPSCGWYHEPSVACTEVLPQAMEYWKRRCIVAESIAPPALEAFYLAIHDLWSRQAALGRASQLRLPLTELDRRLAEAMRSVELAEVAVEKMHPILYKRAREQG